MQEILFLAAERDNRFGKISLSIIELLKDFVRTVLHQTTFVCVKLIYFLLYSEIDYITSTPLKKNEVRNFFTQKRISNNNTDIMSLKSSIYLW